MSKRRIVQLLRRLPGIVIKLLLALMILLPIGWMFCSSLRPSDQIIMYPPEFFPSTVSLENFSNVINTIPIWLYFKNTVLFSGSVTILSVLINSLAGYAFARIDFKGKNAIFTLLMASMMIPFQVIMIPLFMELHFIRLLDTYTGLIIPRIANVIGIFFMRSFFATLPKQLEEAGRVDGLREIGIFFRIMLPNCGAAIATQVILALNANWNELLWPLLMTSSADKRMLSNGICYFVGQNTIQYGAAFAAGVISVLPLLVIFIFGQKYFVNSIVSSAVKE